MLKYQHQLVENLIRDSGGPGSNPSLFHYYNLSQLFKAYKTCKAYGSSSSTHELRSILTLYRLDESFANIHVHKLKKISIFSSKILSYDYFSDRGSNIDYSGQFFLGKLCGRTCKRSIILWWFICKK